MVEEQTLTSVNDMMDLLELRLEKMEKTFQKLDQTVINLL